MLDISFIRDNTDLVKQGMINKGEHRTEYVDHLLDIDAEWRTLVRELDDLRTISNQKSKLIGGLMASGKKDEAQAIIAETSQAKQKIKDSEEREQELAHSRNQLLLLIPNVPHPDVPIGKTPEDNVTVKTWGEIRKKEYRLPHWELTAKYGWIDFERGSKVTGAGFPFYLGPIARLQRSLINFFLDQAVQRGYTEIQPPYFVNEDSARGTGQIPDKEDMMYTIPRDEFFAIPTAEVPVTNYHRDEILSPDSLPLKYAAYTPCWRREAGSYGKDVRGLNRLHQFDKVELVKFVLPETSYQELDKLRSDAEALLEALELPYRTLLMCTGDMGFTQTKKYDLEVWSAAQERWLEVSSCSNFEAFQARRMMVRYRKEDGKTKMVHTLNGSGLALPRVVAALLENHQLPDGSIRLPKVLRAYFGTESIDIK